MNSEHIHSLLLGIVIILASLTKAVGFNPILWIQGMFGALLSGLFFIGVICLVVGIPIKIYEKIKYNRPIWQ